MKSKLITAVSLDVLLWQAAIRPQFPQLGIQNKVRVVYTGLTCRAPIYVAYERAFSRRRDSSLN